jgi:AraC-like DNA-binding protein
MVRHSTLGFAAWRGKPAAMDAAHAHIEVELNLMLTGKASYFLAGRFQSVTANRIALFWAGQPHQLVHTTTDAEFIWLTVPLAWLLQWHIAPAFTKRLLTGELIQDRQPSPADGDLLSRWVSDLRSASTDLRRIVLLEVEARIRRLALAAKPQRTASASASGSMERLTQFVGLHYREELTMSQIAAAVRLHPNYATQSFKRSTGMSLWDYVIRLRVSHAQRLLLTTTDKVLDVALASGFTSASRFYEAFRHYTGSTPQDYRLRFASSSRTESANSP